LPNLNLIYYLIAGFYLWNFISKNRYYYCSSCQWLIGASVLSNSGKVEMAEWPIGTKTILKIGIGTVIGTSLTKNSLVDIQNL